LDELPSTPDDAVDGKTLLEALKEQGIKRTMLYSVLDELTGEGIAGCTGAGKKNDPKRFWKLQEINSSATTGASDESIGTAQEDDGLSCVNCGLMPVTTPGLECDYCMEGN
jgi:hypothetical protein